jgi:hypothetical protein
MANTTSGSYVFDKNLSIDEIIEDAYERIGIQGTSGYQLKTAKRSINTSVTTIGVASVTGFATNGVITIGTEQISYTGISSLNLTGCTRGINGSTAATHSTSDAVLQFPIGMTDIQEADYRVKSTSVDTPMTKISRSQYQGFSNKTSTGLPTQYWVQRFIDKVTMTLYLTPGAAQDGNYINFYYTKRIDDVGAYTNATDVPYRFVPCMISGLAYYLAIKYAPQRVQELKLLYEDELLRAEDEDGSSNSTYISPKIYYPGIG